MLHRCVDVVLAMDSDLLFAGGVIHRHLVITFSLMGVRLQAADHSFAKAIRRHGLWVIDATNNHRLIRVALDESDDYFLTNPGNLHGAPSLAGPVGANP